MHTVNHHSAGVLPFFVHPKDGLTFILEQKDAKYKAPFFDNGLNFAGGNREKGVHDDFSPEDTARREISEEFWKAYEAPESLNDLLGEKFIASEPDVVKKYDSGSIARIKQVVPVFLDGMKHAADYLMTVHPPITRDPLKYGSTIFTKQLSEGEFGSLVDLIVEFDGKLTTDNLKWGSKIVAVSLKEINAKNLKFSWGYCQVMNDLLISGKLPVQKHDDGVLRPLANFVDAERIYRSGQNETSTGCGTYEQFESSSGGQLTYLVKQKK